MKDNLTAILKELGLSTNEIKVSKACMDDFYVASDIASKVKLNRTNTYAIIDGLVKKKVLYLSLQTKVNKYRTVSISRLYDLLENKKKQLLKNSETINKTLESVKGLYNLKRSPEVRFYNGFEDASKFYLSIDYSKETKIITKFLRYANVGELIDNKYINEGSKPILMIVPDNEESRKIIKFQTERDEKYQKKRDFRFVDFKNIPVETEVVIQKGMVSLFCFNETETWAIEFSNLSIINTFDALFTSLWSTAKKEIINLSKKNNEK